MALVARGALLAGYYADTSAGRATADALLGGDASSTLAALVALDADLYLVCVPDGAVHEVARELGALLPAPASESGGLRPTGARPSVAHTSGATSLRALDPCRDAGAATMVFHPLQTFSQPAADPARFHGIAVAVTPSPSPDGSETRAFGFELAEALGATPFFLGDEKRGLYHAAAAMACNHLVTLEHAAEELFVASGLPSKEALSMFLPLVRTTLDNISSQGTTAALTGPLTRGDFETIADHLSALSESSPQVLPLYRSLALATLDLVRARGDLDEPLIESIAGLLLGRLGTDGDDPTAESGATVHPVDSRVETERKSS